MAESRREKLKNDSEDVVILQFAFFFFFDLWLNLEYNLGTRTYTVDGGIAL